MSRQTQRKMESGENSRIYPFTPQLLSSRPSTILCALSLQACSLFVIILALPPPLCFLLSHQVTSFSGFSGVNSVWFHPFGSFLYPSIVSLAQVTPTFHLHVPHPIGHYSLLHLGPLPPPFTSKPFPDISRCPPHLPKST